MHLNWFSPLPPARTDVAQFTARIVPALAQRVQITVWTEEKEYDRGLEKYAKVHVFSNVAEARLAARGISVFNIGNDRAFHKKILEICIAQPGVVILHDLFIPNLVRPPWRRIFSSSETSSNRAEDISYLRKLLSNALGIIVHTRSAFESFRGERRFPVRYQALPYPASDRPLARPTQVGSPHRLIIFGFLGSNRRLQSVLRALENYTHKIDFHLDVYGTMSRPRTFCRLVKKFGLTKKVIFHGFVSEAGLDHALGRADLAINLRYPTMGEASGSQLRIWDYALPSLVTRVGWYADLPPGTVGYVDPESEIIDLQSHFAKLKHDREFYRRMGACGRAALIADHRPEDYATAMIGLACEARRMTQSNPKGHRTAAVI